MNTLEELYRVAFEANLRIDAAQAEMRLAMCADAEFNYGEKGESFTFDFVGNSDPEPMTDRFGNLPDGHISERRRVGHFAPHHDGKAVGASYDIARQVADPTNKKVVSMKRGLARHHDAQIFNAIVGDAYAGKKGVTKVTLPTAQRIAVNYHGYDTGSGDTGLSVSKIMRAKVMFDESEIEGERWIIAPASQIANLLSDDKLASGDYNTVKALVNGEIDTWHGFKYARYERTGLTAAGGGHQRVVACIRDATQYRSRVLYAPDVWLRKDKTPHYYAYYQVDTAGCRGEDKGVIDIACAAVA